MKYQDVFRGDYVITKQHGLLGRVVHAGETFANADENVLTLEMEDHSIRYYQRNEVMLTDYNKAIT